MEREYKNLTTGEVCHDHSVAMGWYRAGHSVACYHNGRHFVTLNAIL